MTDLCLTATQVMVAGSYNLDQIFRCPSLPRPGQTTTGQFEQGHGGKGFNQALACHRLEAATCFMACLGEDASATEIRRWTAEQQLECLWQHSILPTGTAAVLLDETGENAIVVAAGANQHFSADQALGMIESLPDERRIWLLQREIPDACNLKLMSESHSDDIIILNPAPMDASFNSEQLQHVDILTPNETEFEWLLKQVTGMTLRTDWQQMDDEPLHRYCRSLQVPVVIITLGASGCFISMDDARDWPGVSNGRLPARQVSTVVDTTGAGDAFNGALAAGLTRQPASLETALDLAMRAAAYAVSQPGAATAMPTLAELGHHLRSL